MEVTAKPTLTKLTPPERSRKYVYADGTRLEFQNVTAIHVSASGTHRLEMDNGGMVGASCRAIVVPGWRAILLDVDDWTL